MEMVRTKYRCTCKFSQHSQHCLKRTFGGNSIPKKALGNSRGIKGIASVSTGCVLACCSSLQVCQLTQSTLLFQALQRYFRWETASQNEGSKTASLFLNIFRIVLFRQITLYTIAINVNSQMGERSGIGVAGQRSEQEKCQRQQARWEVEIRPVNKQKKRQIGEGKGKDSQRLEWHLRKEQVLVSSRYYQLWQSPSETDSLSFLSSIRETGRNGKKRTTYKIWGWLFFYQGIYQLELTGNKQRNKPESCLAISIDPQVTFSGCGLCRRISDLNQFTSSPPFCSSETKLSGSRQGGQLEQMAQILSCKQGFFPSLLQRGYSHERPETNKMAAREITKAVSKWDVVAGGPIYRSDAILGKVLVRSSRFHRLCLCTTADAWCCQSATGLLCARQQFQLQQTDREAQHYELNVAPHPSPPHEPGKLGITFTHCKAKNSFIFECA